MEMLIRVGKPNKELTIQLYPLDPTFDKIERWKEVHEVNSTILFPEKAIQS